jgi:hypothetical protein
MFNPLDKPLLLLAVSLPVFWISSQVGAWLHRENRFLDRQDHDDFRFVLGGTLTMLALIIGFVFAMAVSRYDLRYGYEEQEANAIGTEYLRASFLPAIDRANIRELLARYLDERILNYTARDERQLSQITTQTAGLQTEMWSAVSASAGAQPNVMNALAVSGMNDVLNSQGYTEAAWSNRIPIAAWALLIVVAIFCNFLIGSGASESSGFLFFILPIVLSISLFLIADIDSPRHGIIHVHPKDLLALARSLRSQ